MRKIPDEDTDRVHLSAEEAAAMAGADGGDDLGEECKKAFVLACLTGLRVSDLEELKWGDVDRDRLHKRQHKTGDIAHVPLSASAREIIGGCENHKPDERIFPLLLERGRDASNYRIRRLARTAGIRKRVGWHTARHTFAVLSLEAGTGIYTLSRLLGHRSVKTTEVYARATDKLKREAVDALPDLRIKKLP
ncbi:MAG: site-specific integrase [Treponema sp.]|nr:site-specific integrase [Treponema sp.]